MRRVGILQDAKAANRFAAALIGRGLKVELRPESDGSVGVWALEEDRLEDARRELADFQRDPASKSFNPPPAAPAPAREPHEPTPARTPWEKLPVTLTLIGICVVVAAVTLGGPVLGYQELASRVESDLSIARTIFVDVNRRSWIPEQGLSAVEKGEVWRLVTPIFLHGDPLHLLLNMAWLWLLGSAVESLRGSWRLGLLVLATAITSNLAEYYLDFAFDFDVENGLRTDIGVRENPIFLGMSGVVFGLFGFVWMRARLFSGSGFAMPRDTVVWMLIWLVVCTSGLIGPVANVAHGVGLLTGLLIGAAPRLWRKAYPHVAPTSRSERA